MAKRAAADAAGAEAARIELLGAQEALSEAEGAAALGGLTSGSESEEGEVRAEKRARGGRDGAAMTLGWLVAGPAEAISN